MENTTAMPNPGRKVKKLLAFQDQRAQELRAAAARAERNGQPVAAVMFRNAAYAIEQEGKL